MLEAYNFHLEQLLFTKGAMDQLAEFRPFSKTPAQVLTMITDTKAMRPAFLAKFAVRESGRAGLRAAQADGHQAAVQVYAFARSLYAKDRKSLDMIRRLPKRDYTAAQTITRMSAISELWATLPNPPGQATAFVAGPLTKEAFDALLADLNAKQTTYAACTLEFAKADADLQELDTANAQFISGALAQGRAQYLPGTPGRSVIDTIPTEPSAQPPDQAVISVAESSTGGAVRLEFAAERATSFQVWHKGPGEAQFTQAEEVLDGVYVKTGLSEGQHQYQAVGVNSRGEGEASVPVSLNVAKAEAA